MRRLPVHHAVLVLLVAVATALVPAAGAEAAHGGPSLTDVRCVPPTARRCAHGVHVRIGQQLQLRGRRLRRRMRVTFRWPKGAIATRLRRTRAGWIVRVPPGVRTGTVWVSVSDRHWHRSRARKVHVLADTTPAPPQQSTTAAAGQLPAVFAGNGMWIWQLPRADGGNVDAIAARAHAAGIATVFVKAADGASDFDNQLTPQLISDLHIRGLRVCAWQYVYGSDPAGEARQAVAEIQRGADCFVIDAESEYQGRYGAAQQYMAAVRAAVGADYPIGLTSFPYVDYHPGLPFSVFLGPGGAQANLPQVYWKAIGGGVDAVSAHTLAENRIYGAPLAPIGQAYDTPPPEEVQRFRQLWAAYGSQGLSWWSWQHADAATWTALATPPPAAAAIPEPGWPALARGSKGDQVVWLQEHLRPTYPTVPIDGVFGSSTADAVSAVQTAHGLPATGQTDADTWAQVLALPMQSQDWVAEPHGTTATAASVRRRAPRSATLPARRDEIPPPAQRGR